jgi:hypothetical protein
MRLGGLVARNRSFGNIPKRIKSSLNANQVIVECGLSIPLGRGLQLGEAASPRWPLILQHFYWVVGSLSAIMPSSVSKRSQLF